MTGLPDDRVDLANDEPQHERQNRDLDDSIDALLSEIDASCARAEDPASGEQAPPQTGRPDPETPPEMIGDETDAPEDDPAATASDVPVEPGEPVEPETVGTTDADDTIDDNTDENTTEVDASPEPEPESVDSGKDALSALEAVSGGAQSLIEDAIEDLLDGDAPEAIEVETHQADPAAGASTQEAMETSDITETLGDDELLAQIADELSPPENVDSLVEEIEDIIGAEATVEDEPESAEESAEAAATTTAPADATPTPEPEPEPEPVGGIAQAGDETIDDQTTEDKSTDDETTDGETAGDETTGDKAPTPESDSSDQDPVGVNASEGSDPDESVGALDAALAEMDDELLMGDFETPDGELIDSSELEGSIDPVMLLDQLGLPEQEQDSSIADDDGIVEINTEDESSSEEEDRQPTPAEATAADTDPNDTVSAVSAAQSRGASVRAVPTKPVRPRAEEDAHGSVLVEGDDLVESMWQTLRRLSVTHGTQAWEIARVRGGPVAARVILRVSKPLKDKPRVVRDSVGYIALWTLLLACVLWFYVMFLRTPPAPVPAQAPTRVMAPGDTGDPLVRSEMP